ncbi:MAG: hypothetical protein J6Y83_04865 [Bacteroidales bacterium]|nr:hypothetical protein [Bacteroidales bacterium]
MIYLVIVTSVACVALAGIVAGLETKCKYMRMQISKLEARAEHNFDYIMRVESNLISTSQHVAELEKTVEENSDESRGEKLEELLAKKWEDAIQTISDFDPFRAGEDK